MFSKKDNFLKLIMILLIKKNIYSFTMSIINYVYNKAEQNLSLGVCEFVLLWIISLVRRLSFYKSSTILLYKGTSTCKTEILGNVKFQ